MFKTWHTLFRGASHDAADALADKYAVPLLRQQIRDSAMAVLAAKKAVALAIAQNEHEAAQNELLRRRLQDLEQRAIDALAKDKADLAHEAAQAIALLEDELAVCDQAQAQFTTRIAKLKHNLQLAESRLRELQRGQRLASATQSTQRLREQVCDTGPASLADAEQTLARLNKRQAELERSAEILDSFDLASEPDKVARKLADAGCGAPRKTRAEDVLERLAEQARKKK